MTDDLLKQYEDQMKDGIAFTRQIAFRILNLLGILLSEKDNEVMILKIVECA